RKKLSKRDQHIVQFIEQYRDLGYLPEALFNFITLLGWSAVGADEIFSTESLIVQFDSNRLLTSEAVFDSHKPTWTKREYIKQENRETVIDLAMPHLMQSGKVPADMDDAKRHWVEEVITLYQQQLRYGAEIVELTSLFFKEDIEYDEAAMEVLKGEQVIE